MLSAAAAMAGILASWAVAMVLLVGMGVTIRRLCGLKRISTEAIFESFWIGLVAAVLLLSLWHLALPVRWPVQAGLVVVGLAGLLSSLRPLGQWLGSVVARRRGTLIAAAIVAVGLSNRALGPCTTHDSGLYHLSAVRWTTDYRIVPGLGNLHTPLAYNNASFLMAAAWEIGPWYGRSSHVANPLYILVFGLQCAVSAARLLRGDSRRMVAAVFDLLMITPLVLMLNRSWAASHNVEVSIAVVLMVAARQALGFLTDPRSSDRETDFEVLGILLLLVLGVSIKISSLITAAILGTAIIVAYVRRCHQAGRGLGALGWILSLPAIVFLVWLVRGVILSGYLLYPFPVGSLSVEWRMPVELVNQARQAIRTDAFEDIAQEGVLDWTGHLGREVLMPMVIVLVGLAVVARWRKGLDRVLRPAWLVALATVPAIVIWAVTAPQKRFAFYLFWILAGVVGALALAAVGALSQRRYRTVVACVLVIVGLMNIDPDNVFFGPGGDGGLHPTPSVEMTTYVTRSGLVLYVPKTGTQCWDSPLPSTPTPHPNLRLRRPGELASGFVLAPSPASQPEDSQDAVSAD